MMTGRMKMCQKNPLMSDESKGVNIATDPFATAGTNQVMLSNPAILLYEAWRAGAKERRMLSKRRITINNELKYWTQMFGEPNPSSICGMPKGIMLSSDVVFARIETAFVVVERSTKRRTHPKTKSGP